MTLTTLFLVAAAGTLQASAPARLPDQQTSNVVVNGEPATVSFLCANGKLMFRLHWPVRIMVPFLDVGVGSGSGMDASMGPAEHWRTLDDAERRTVLAPMTAAAILASSADEKLLLLNVQHGSNSTTVELDALKLKVAFKEQAGHCFPE